MTDVERVVAALRASETPLRISQLCDAAELQPTKVVKVLQILADAAQVTCDDEGHFSLIGGIGG